LAEKGHFSRFPGKNWQELEQPGVSFLHDGLFPVSIAAL